MKREIIKEELLKRAIETFKLYIDEDEVYYALAFDCNSYYTTHVFGLNTKEEFEDTLKSYRRQDPLTYCIPDEIEELKYNPGDWAYFNISPDGDKYKALDSSGDFIKSYGDSAKACEEFMILVCEALIDFMETDVFKSLPKTDDFEAICIDHDETLEKARERMRHVSYFYKKKAEESTLHNQEAVITIEEAEKRGYEISEEMKGQTMIFFSPSCIGDYDTMKYIKKQWLQVGSENSKREERRCRVLLANGGYCIRYADWVISFKDLKQECGIFLFDGENKPVILYGEVDALGIGLACTKKWPESPNEYESLRKHFLDKESPERSTDKAWVEAEADEDFDRIMNSGYYAWKEREAEDDLQDIDEDNKVHFITSRLLLKYFAEKRGDMKLVKHWDEQIKDVNEEEEVCETCEPAKKYATYMMAYDIDKDEDEPCEDDLIEIFNVDIDDKDHITATLKALSKKLTNKDFLEKLDSGASLTFGIVKNDIIKDIYGNSDFYRKAAEYEEVRPTLQKLCKQIIRINHRNSGCPMWENDEDLFGANPAFALALTDKKYMDTTTNMMCSMYNGDHTTPDEYSSELFEKWGPCPETIKYFAASLIAMPMQDIAVQINAAMNHEEYREYFKSENNIDLFLAYYAEYVKNAKHYDYKRERETLAEWILAESFQSLFPDKSEDEILKMSYNFVDLLREESIPTYELLTSE